MYIYITQTHVYIYIYIYIYISLNVIHIEDPFFPIKIENRSHKF